jgi:ABC-type glycerol-3-phosphate transport system substrate-binding protein
MPRRIALFVAVCCTPLAFVSAVHLAPAVAQDRSPSVLRISVASTAGETGRISSLAKAFEARHPGVTVQTEYAGAIAVLDCARGELSNTVFMYNEFELFSSPNSSGCNARKG